MSDDRERTPADGLSGAYDLNGPDDAAAFYDGWAATYDTELDASGYITPRRCAAALARFATVPDAPTMDLGCGSGLSGVALRAEGFTCIDGFDISPGMLEMARAKGVYRDLSVCDLSAPLDIASGQYRNAAAVGCLSPNTMSPMVIDAVLDLLPPGGCFVFSINDHAASDGTLVGRIMERTDCGAAELLFSEHGDHLPSIDLKATVYVLRNRG